MDRLKALLDAQVAAKCTPDGLKLAADPLNVVRDIYSRVGGEKIDKIALICALFSYGNAGQIVKFLGRLDFDIIDESEREIGRYVAKNGLKYRFQTPSDITQIFVAFKRLWGEDFEQILLHGMARAAGAGGEECEIAWGINELIARLLREARAAGGLTPGLDFCFARPFEKWPKSPYKRYNMWLRWMARDSDIDLGIYKKISKSRLILPLDTHTHKVSLRLGLCDKKSYDFGAALIITQKLRAFDKDDPIKYDFALYRLGQLGEA